eukprot:1946554-Rhodomonas_salina.2
MRLTGSPGPRRPTPSLSLSLNPPGHHSESFSLWCRRLGPRHNLRVRLPGRCDRWCRGGTPSLPSAHLPSPSPHTPLRGIGMQSRRHAMSTATPHCDSAGTATKQPERRMRSQRWGPGAGVGWTWSALSRIAAGRRGTCLLSDAVTCTQALSTGAESNYTPVLPDRLSEPL